MIANQENALVAETFAPELQLIGRTENPEVACEDTATQPIWFDAVPAVNVTKT